MESRGEVEAEPVGEGAVGVGTRTSARNAGEEREEDEGARNRVDDESQYGGAYGRV